jgi:predicted transcriptional regulator
MSEDSLVIPGSVERVMQSLSKVDELFHRVGRAIPANQEMLSLNPDMRARDAISLLNSHFYSQAPVAIGTRVLGVFSFRSFARKAADYSLDELKKFAHAPGDLPVEDCMEKYNFAHLSDELHQHFDALERDNGVLVGNPESMGAILTPMDVLRYLYKVASPFVYLQEIELAVRTLIRSAATDEQIKIHASMVLKQQGGRDVAIPETLEQMTFDNYRLIVASGNTWPNFEIAFGGTRPVALSKFNVVGDLRNTLFHFKRPLSDKDYENIKGVRDWLLRRVERLGIVVEKPSDE